MQVINLFGGPCTGKSTTAAGTFFLFKLAGHETELVTEYAKYLVWAERVKMFQEQGYVFAKQNHKLEILRDKVQYAVTDSPLLLGALYNRLYSGVQSLEDYLLDIFTSYNNINIFLERTSAYNPKGRVQTEEQAKQIDTMAKSLLEELHMPYTIIKADYTAPWEIYKTIFNKEHETQISK